MLEFDFVAQILGLSADPLIFFLIESFLLASFAFEAFFIVFNYFLLLTPINYFFPPVLPAFLIITSFEYLIPLPLYGSGGLKDLIFAAAKPTSSLLAPLNSIVFLPTLALTP